MPVPHCHVFSAKACPKTVVRRSNQLSQLREVISGGECSVQLQSELNRLPALKGIQLPVSIPANHALAMKVDLVGNKDLSFGRTFCPSMEGFARTQ